MFFLRGRRITMGFFLPESSTNSYALGCQPKAREHHTSRARSSSRKRCVRARGTSSSSSLITHPDAKRLGALAQEVAAGRLVIPIARRFRFGEARRAQELAQHHAGGKVILAGPDRTRGSAHAVVSPLR
jgi:hypothetical protein